MEKEICRKETTRKVTTAFKYAAYVCLAFAALSFAFTVFILTVNDSWEYLFRLDASYGIPALIFIAFAILTALFFRIDKKTSDVKTSLVLTNKRIYCQFEISKTKQCESYNLNTVLYYAFHQTLTNGNARSTLILKTSTNTAKFTVDEEFYNAFVNAVNATVPVTD